MDSTSISEEHLLNYYYLIYKLFKNFKWRRKCYNIPYNKYKVEGRETLSDFFQVSIKTVAQSPIVSEFQLRQKVSFFFYMHKTVNLTRPNMFYKRVSF